MCQLMLISPPPLIDCLGLAFRSSKGTSGAFAISKEKVQQSNHLHY